MKQRSVYKDEPYWKSTISHFLRSAKRMEKLAIDQKNDDELRPRGLRQSWHRRLQLICAHYSAGTPIPRIAEIYDQLVDKLALFNADDDAISQYRAPLTDIDSYVDTLAVLSLGLLFGVPPKRLAPVLTFAGRPGQDALVDILCVAIGAERAVSKKTLHKPFEWLVRAYTADDPAEAGAAVVEFLQRYYAGVKRSYFYNSHLLADGGFAGYWSYEVAAVVFASDINDEGFVDNVFYPSDLTGYARSRRQHA